jgi:biotin carboxyl carrier protein
VAFVERGGADRFVAFLEGERYEIEVGASAEGATHRVAIGEESFEVDACFVESDTWLLLVDGVSYEVGIVADATHPERLTVTVRGERIGLEVLDPRRLRLRAAAGGMAVEGEAEVVAPMPGKIVKVLVEEGQAVAEGEGVVVVEAMKMENELRAPRAGTVAGLSVAEGDTVEGGSVLMRIE